MTMNRILGGALALAGAVLMLAPGAAQARWYGGVVVGVPYVMPPPVYYPPPAYYPPPVYVAPGYAPPPYAGPTYVEPGYAGPGYAGPGQADASAPPPPGQVCHAGSYICPLDRPTPSGNSCACPTSNGRAWGRAQ